jgi:cytochrome P450
MPDSNSKQCPFSVKGFEGKDPYPVYESMREFGDIVWDEGMKAWLVLSADGCRKLMGNDVKKLRFWTTDLPEAAADIQGTRGLKLATGDYHFQLHSWWLRQFAPAELKPFREAGIRPLVHRLIDRFAADGRVDLIAQFASLLPIRAICVIMDLPWRDDDWVAHCFETMKPIEAFFNYTMVGDNTVIDAARAAANKMNSILMPFIDQRRAGTGNDMISRLWRDGPGLRPDWGDLDVVTNVRHMMFAGSETTTHALANAFYVLMTEPGIAGKIRDAGERGVNVFVEEMLRLYGPVQLRSRRANEDIEVAGLVVKKDQSVVSVQSAANRDPNKYSNPTEIDLNRKNPHDHIAFNYGPRTCVGAGLARIEMQESIIAFLERLPDLRLDPAAPKPEFHGFQLREFRPLKALFTPA